MRRGSEIFGLRKMADCACSKLRNAHFAAGALRRSPHSPLGETRTAAFRIPHLPCVVHWRDAASGAVHHPLAHSVVESASAQTRSTAVKELRIIFFECKMPA